MTYTRNDLDHFGLGRSLGHGDGETYIVIIARDKGMYDVTHAKGTVRVRDFSGMLLGAHRPHPTDEDLAWLRRRDVDTGP